METIIETRNLTKVFGSKEIVSDVCMRIQKGQIYGFLGENGAGKSTIMKMILGLVKPTNGSIYLFGHDRQQNQSEDYKRIGSIIEEPIFYNKLTAIDNLKLHCEYMGEYDPSAISHIIDLLGLSGNENIPVGKFSVGMRQRLAIGRAIMTKPELLILDEPINGLDPSGIKEMRGLFRRLNEESGTTILISSHILSEIEQIATTIGVLANHHLVKEVPIQEIHSMKGDYLELKVDDSRKAAVILDTNLKVKNFKVMSEETIRIYDNDLERNQIMLQMMNHGIRIDSIVSKQVSLEDYFLKLSKEA